MFVRAKRVCSTLAVTLLLHTTLAAVQPAAVRAEEAPVAQSTELQLNAKSAVLMDAATGQILYQYNADQAFPPASMAKMMTEYLVMEAVDAGKLKMDEMITASQYAADVIGSGGLLANNEQATVDNMFAAMSIYSSNDASVALAERIGGSEEKFAQMMNDKAKELGLSAQAHFNNATGLSIADLGKYAPKENKQETMLTAKDAAIIAYRIIKDHPKVLEYTKTPTRKFREKDPAPMVNWNWMLEGNKDNANFKRYAYQGLDGLKTGHTNEAGYCFTGTAERNGMRLISVVMGTPTEPKRFEETRKVLDYGFNNFESKQIAAAGAPISSLQTVNIKKGVETEVPVVTEQEMKLVVKKGTPDSEIQVTGQALADESKITAPIQKGQVLGTAKVTYNGSEHTVNLVAAQEVEKGSWVRLFFRAIKNVFVDTISGAKKG
ncbi:D-alanyl-D-alanine carboxypeptidase family protein [Paenibacillus sp. KR2-11]|uniref:D-alanyl-D-alanine carboxypeptidase family protein n=1 Tax=Paenibacillus sp. KR2-11 TaxID=3385500 RepID=UPI0038FD197D